jgi:hypothetical protein
VTCVSIPAPLRHLVDDAAGFPPGRASLDDALSAHERYRRSSSADLVGPLVLGTDLLPRLVERVEASPTWTADAPLRLAVVTGAAEVEDSVRQVSGPAGLVVAALEVRLDVADAAVAQVGRLAADRTDLVDDGTLPAAARVHVEVPRPPGTAAAGWNALLDAVRDNGFRLKFRTGGVTADAFPSEDELARWVLAARDRATPFKCTAGLHHAVRHAAGDTGFEHHGYLNVLLAATRAASGGGPDEVRSALAERDPRVVAEQVSGAGEPALLAGRALFTSYGSCSVLEPLHDLVALGLLPPEVEAGTTDQEGAR